MHISEVNIVKQAPKGKGHLFVFELRETGKKQLRYHATALSTDNPVLATVATRLNEQYDNAHRFESQTEAMKRFKEMLESPITLTIGEDPVSKKIRERKEAETKMRRDLWNELNKIVGFTVPTDGLMTVVSNKLSINLTKFDDMIGYRVTEYNPTECTYKGKEDYSMKMVIQEHYGDRAVEIVTKLMH